MKNSTFITSLLLFVLITGCGTVVYRINPESPPQMSISEARDALELSLSLINRHRNTEGIKADESHIEIIRFSSATTLGSASSWRYRAYYDQIEPQVSKIGSAYFVRFAMASISHTSDYETLSWKSEEDAKLFVNAAYVLRKKEYKDEQPVQTGVAPVQKIITKLPVDDKDKIGQSKADVQDLSRKKEVAAVVETRTRVRPSIPPLMADERDAPKILITSPDLTRAVSVVARRSSLTISGIAESKSGIADVLVNGQPAELDEKGQFSADILLKVGRNDITVTATDIRNNKATKQFFINRDSGRIASAKAEAPIQAPSGLQSAKYYGLFIAVQDYDSSDINKLDYPVSDARQLMETLTSGYTFEKDNIIFLQNPDRRTIYVTMQSLRYRLTEKDNLLIFYAGHGTWMEDMRQGFWLPRDAAGPNDPSDWIPNSNIRDYIKAIKARHILLVADACFSGGMFKVRAAFPDPKASVEKIYELPSRKAITSGSLKTVPDRSTFAEFLVKRLKDNREPYLDTQKLFTSLREAVINNSSTSQTPLYGAINEAGDEGGDFVFVRRQ